MRKRHLLIAVACHAVACASAVGCLSNLEQPLDCPVPPQVIGSYVECAGAFGDTTEEALSHLDADFCAEADVLGCYRPPPLSCACLPTECPEQPRCNPPPDCPEEVLEAHPTARCVELTEEDIGPFVGAAEQCLCGCERCLLACDGVGPVWSQLDVDMDLDGIPDQLAGLLAIDMRRHVPDEGRLGAYVRARGVTSGAQGVATAPPELYSATADNAFLVGTIPPLMDDRFDAVVIPAGDPHAWTAADVPESLILSNEINNVSLYEIDCIVPFIVE